MDSNPVLDAHNAVLILDFISTFAFAWVGARVAVTAFAFGEVEDQLT